MVVEMIWKVLQAGAFQNKSAGTAPPDIAQNLEHVSRFCDGAWSNAKNSRRSCSFVNPERVRLRIEILSGRAGEDPWSDFGICCSRSASGASFL